MTAAVAQTGQRVVLGQDPDPRPGAAATAGQPGPDRRGEPASRRLHLEAVPPERLGDPGRGLVLFVRRLRGRVDPMREVEELGAVRLDGLRETALRVGEWLRGAGGRVELWHGRLLRDRATLAGWSAGQRSAESVASATATIVRTNRAIGSWSAPWRRSATKSVTTIATHAPRRMARSQSPR